MPDLHQLLERVETAIELDPTLFWDVACGVVPNGADATAWRLRIDCFLGAGAWESALLALVERVLPGWRWGVSTRNYSGTSMQAPCRAAVWPGEDGYRASEAYAKTPALALLAALLKALIEKGDLE